MHSKYQIQGIQGVQSAGKSGIKRNRGRIQWTFESGYSVHVDGFVGVNLFECVFKQNFVIFSTCRTIRVSKMWNQFNDGIKPVLQILNFPITLK